MLEEYLNLYSVCKKKFVTEDDKRSVFDKDCILCGVAKSILSTSKDMVFYSYIKRLLLVFETDMMGFEVEDLLECTEDLDMFKPRLDNIYGKPDTICGASFFNKRIIISSLYKLYNRVNGRDDNTKIIETEFDDLIILLNNDIEIKELRGIELKKEYKRNGNNIF